MHVRSKIATATIATIVLFAASAQSQQSAGGAAAGAIATGASRYRWHSDSAANRTDGKPFEEVCPGTMIGMAVRTKPLKKIFGIPVVENQPIMAVAPICQNADGSRAPLAWHGGKGSDEEYLLRPGHPIMALRGRYLNGSSLINHFMLFTGEETLPSFGKIEKQEDRSNDEIFFAPTPFNTEVVGIFGRAGKDELNAIGLVYSQAPPRGRLAAMASEPPPSTLTPEQVQAAVARGIKLKGDLDGAQVRNSYISLLRDGYYAFIEGPTDRLVNEVSRRAQRKHPVTVDSVSSPYPALVTIQVQTFDRASEKIGGFKIDVSTVSPASVHIVSGAPGEEKELLPVWNDVTYTEIGSDTGNNNIPAMGITAAFEASAVPTGPFVVRIKTTKGGTYDIKVEQKSRASIH